DHITQDDRQANTMMDHVEHHGLADTYADHFDIVRADSPTLLDEAYHLRYQVYCVENPFENAAEHLDGRERDPDHDRSVRRHITDRQMRLFMSFCQTETPVIAAAKAGFGAAAYRTESPL